MKLEELRKLRKGTKLLLNDGNGWFEEVRYLSLVQVTSLGRATFQDIVNGNFDFTKGGRKRHEAYIEYTDDKGRKQNTYVNPRRLRKEN